MQQYEYERLLQALISTCLGKDPKARPSTATLLQGSGYGAKSCREALASMVARLRAAPLRAPRAAAPRPVTVTAMRERGDVGRHRSAAIPSLEAATSALRRVSRAAAFRAAARRD